MPNPTPTDTQILEWLARPDTYERGFRALVARHQVALYGHVRHLVGNHTDADDVLQNTFIKVHRHIGQFKGESRLYTWLYRIATNEALSFLQQRQRKGGPPQSLEALAEGQGAQWRADSPLDSQDLARRFQQAIAQLPDKQRQVFHLRYFDELPYQDMSDLLGTSVGALKASYHHAVRKIEAFFNPD